MMIVLLGLFVYTTWIDRRPQLEGHWGGLGGGVGGWRISPSLLFLVAAVGVGLIGAGIATTLISRRPPTVAATDKYQSVVRLMAQLNVRSIETYQQGNKVIVKGEAPDQVVKDRIWEQIKLVNPNLDDVIGDVTVASGAKK
jgi:hypothetical protein